MKRTLALLTLAAAVILVGCASGPQFGTAQGNISPLAEGKGRIFFYRSTSLGGLIQPDIRLNGDVVGSAKPNAIFYVDRDPGNMEVVIGTEVEKRLTFTLSAGDVRYVKCDVKMGLIAARIIPTLVDGKDAAKEISDLALTGSK